MSDWVLVALLAIAAAYKLAAQWLASRGGGERGGYGETPPPGNDTLVENMSMPHDVYDDGERRLPPVRLGFQREER